MSNMSELAVDALNAKKDEESVNASPALRTLEGELARCKEAMKVVRANRSTFHLWGEFKLMLAIDAMERRLKELSRS